MSNVGYTPGAGKTIGTDSISSVEYQRVKTVIGATGKTSDMRAVTPGQSVASTAAGTTIASSSGILFGIAYWSTATGAATMTLRDSTTSSTGNVLWGATLSTGVGTRTYNEWFGPQGVKMASGLRVVRSGVKTNVIVYYVSPTPA